VSNRLISPLMAQAWLRRTLHCLVQPARSQVIDCSGCVRVAVSAPRFGLAVTRVWHAAGPEQESAPAADPLLTIWRHVGGWRSMAQASRSMLSAVARLTRPRCCTLLLYTLPRSPDCGASPGFPNLSSVNRRRRLH
jgi:hypothetical protein